MAEEIPDDDLTEREQEERRLLRRDRKEAWADAMSAVCRQFNLFPDDARNRWAEVRVLEEGDEFIIDYDGDLSWQRK